jgi:hypothetical protein
MVRVWPPLRGGLVAAVVLGVGAAAAPTARGGWSTSVNGLGFGNVQVDVWCFPNAPPGAPNYTAVAGGFGAAAALGPGLAGCDPATTVAASIGVLWTSEHNGVAAGGDTIDSVDLYPLVTPTSPVATISLSVVGTVLDPETVLFTIDWSGSDAGTAQRLQWYSDDTLTTLLHEELRVGPFDEAFGVAVFNPIGMGGADTIVLVADGIATSVVPEPASLAPAGVAAAVGLAARRRFRPA